MDIRRILILIIFVLFLTACISEKSAEITAAEVSATQVSIERKTQRDLKAHNIKMALAWPVKIVTWLMLTTTFIFALRTANKVVNQILNEREIAINEKQLSRIAREERMKSEQPKRVGGYQPDRPLSGKLKPPMIGSAVNDDFNEIVRLAETKLK